MTQIDFGNQWPLHSFRHFEIISCEKSSYVVENGSSFQINGRIKNNAQEYATTYFVVKLANASDQHAIVCFDSDRDFKPAQKEALRFVDVPPLGYTDFSITIPVHNLSRSTLDMRLELWSPGRLRYPQQSIDTVALFYRSNWGNGIDVIMPEDLIAEAFISYSWQSPEHVKWVNRLAQELSRRQIRAVLDQKDLEYGQEVTKFMRTGIKLPVVIAICSSSYVEKANEGISGVGYEVSQLSSQILNGRNRATIIPVIRDNEFKLLPDCLDSALYVDMDKDDWNGKALTNLANQIIKYCV